MLSALARLLAVALRRADCAVSADPAMEKTLNRTHVVPWMAGLQAAMFPRMKVSVASRCTAFSATTHARRPCSTVLPSTAD